MSTTLSSLRRTAAGRRGFTMIELVAVVTLVAVAMAIVAPRFRLSEETEVQLAGMQIAQDIDVARTRALTTRTTARVAFQVLATRYGGYLDHDGDGSFSESTAEWQALRGFGVRDLPPRVRFGRGSAPAVPDNSGGGAVTFPGNRLEFDSRGLVTPRDGFGVVYLQSTTNANAVVAVSVSPSGSPRLWTWKPSTGWQ